MIFGVAVDRPLLKSPLADAPQVYRYTLLITNFVGKYIPPVFWEVELTPEEQEALRKKEELKNKRHQAYLRCKASGWQQAYEERSEMKIELDYVKVGDYCLPDLTAEPYPKCGLRKYGLLRPRPEPPRV